MIQNRRIRKLILRIFIVLILGAGVVVLGQRAELYKKDYRVFLIPPISMKFFTLGYRDTLADIFWIRVIQDLGNCEQTRKGSPFNKWGARIGLDRTPECRLSWSYHVLNLIMELAPRFHMPANSGPLILSVITDDIEGATRLYEKALRNFPQDWQITYHAAYHFMTEVEDKKRASELFRLAAQLGAPQWTRMLAAKLDTQRGEYDLAELILKKYLSTVEDDPFLKNRIENKLAEIAKMRKESAPEHKSDSKEN